MHTIKSSHLGIHVEWECNCSVVALILTSANFGLCYAAFGCEQQFYSFSCNFGTSHGAISCRLAGLQFRTIHELFFSQKHIESCWHEIFGTVSFSSRHLTNQEKTNTFSFHIMKRPYLCRTQYLVSISSSPWYLPRLEIQENFKILQVALLLMKQENLHRWQKPMGSQMTSAEKAMGLVMRVQMEF